MAREEVARNQRSRLYGGDDRGGRAQRLPAHDRRPRDRARRASRAAPSTSCSPNKEECFLATYDIVVAQRAQARARGVAVRARLGQPPARRLQGAARRRRRARRRARAWCSSTRSASARGRANGCSSPASRSSASSRPPSSSRPSGVGFPQLTSRAIVGGRPPRRLQRGCSSAASASCSTLTDEVLDWIEAYRIARRRAAAHARRWRARRTCRRRRPPS